MNNDAAKLIEDGDAVLGMELGSTRIKAVLIDPEANPLAAGGHGWENSQIDGIWTYALDEVWTGAAAAFAALRQDASEKYGVNPSSLSALGFSGMMHGYLPFDEHGELLVPFRTWRNNITGEAAARLTDLFRYPIPQRWSIAHLHHALLGGEDHLKNIAFITTLSGYVHWKLTGEKILGIGDASGMFPVNPETLSFDADRIRKYNSLLASRGIPWKLEDVLPQIRPAGEPAGHLTESGARLLDPTGALKPGIPLCPPEGDAGTGMAATSSVRPRTGNVSAGTSVFAMVVLEREPSSVHEEIDLIATPDGKLVGMAHSNNCTSDYDAWIRLLGDAAKALGADISVPTLYDTLLQLALEGDTDCGGLMAFGYVSGEHVTGFTEGRPLFVRPPESPLTIENFMRTHLFTSLCALSTGLRVLMDEEGLQLDELRGHGGFFKTPQVGQRIMAAATRTPVSVPESAGEGGAWGMALLAAFLNRPNQTTTLADFLDAALAGKISDPVKPDPADEEGFETFFKRYHRCLDIEAAAVKAL